jgi:hypothetical protein
MYSGFDKREWEIGNAGMSHEVGLNPHEVLRLHDELRGTRLSLFEGIARMGYDISQFAGQAPDGMSYRAKLTSALAFHLKLYRCDDCDYWYDELIGHDCSAKKRLFPELRLPEYVVARILKAHQERYLACEALKQASTLDSVEGEVRRIRRADAQLEVLYDMIGKTYRPRPRKREVWPEEWPIEEVSGD